MSIPTSYRPVVTDCDDNVFNLNTYGKWDWAIFALILIIYSLCWCTIGICCHRWQVRKLLLTDDNIDDIESVKKRARFNSIFSRWSARSGKKSKRPHAKQRHNSQENVMLSPPADYLKPEYKKASFSTINEEESELKESHISEPVIRPDFRNKHLAPAMAEPRASVMSEMSMTSVQIQPIVGKSFAFPSGKGNKVSAKTKEKYKGQAITVEVDQKREEQIAAAAPAQPQPQPQPQYAQTNHLQPNNNQYAYSAHGNQFGGNVQGNMQQPNSYHPAMGQAQNQHEAKQESSDSSEEDNLSRMYAKDGKKDTQSFHEVVGDQVVILHDSSERNLKNGQANQPQMDANNQFPHISFGLYGQQ